MFSLPIKVRDHVLFEKLLRGFDYLGHSTLSYKNAVLSKLSSGAKSISLIIQRLKKITTCNLSQEALDFFFK